MRLPRIILGVVLLLALAGCGPIYSAIAKGGEGIQDYKVVRGDLTDLKPGGSMLVFGPFGITGDAYYIAKGEDASQFAGRLKQSGFQKTDLLIEHTFKNLEKTSQRLRSLSAAQLKADYDLEIEPDTILFGTILERGPVTVVPFRAVMPVSYRLEFFDVARKTSTVVEVSVKMRYEEIIPAIIEETMRRSAG